MHQHHLDDIIRGGDPSFLMGVLINTKTEMEELIFHIYDSNNEVIKSCVSIDELEQMIAARKIDWKHWEIEPCYTEYSAEDASF